MNLAEQGTSVGLRALSRLASSDLLDRVGLREVTERLVHRGTRNGFRAANAAGRRFAAAQKLAGPARQKHGKRPDLFDLEPSDEQKMMIEAFGDFAATKLRPAAQQADAACAAPADVLDQSAEIGLPILGVPEELGGIAEERSAMAGDPRRRGARPRRHGPRRRRRSRPARSAPRSACGAPTSSRRPTCRPSPATTCPAAALALTEPRVALRPARPRDHRRARRRRLRPRRREVAGPARRRRRAVRRRRRARRRRPARCSSSSPAPTASRSRPSPSMGAARRLAVPARARRRPGRRPRAARRSDGDDYAECVRLSPARLVRAGGRHRAGGARLRDALRQRARGVRRADQPPPVGGVHGRQHRRSSCRACGW